MIEAGSIDRLCSTVDCGTSTLGCFLALAGFAAVVYWPRPLVLN